MRCHWCGEKTHRGNGPLDSKRTRDHVIALSRGGTNTRDNIVRACWWCNLHKAAELPSEWITRLAALDLDSKPDLHQRKARRVLNRWDHLIRWQQGSDDKT